MNFRISLLSLLLLTGTHLFASETAPTISTTPLDDALQSAPLADSLQVTDSLTANYAVANRQISQPQTAFKPTQLIVPGALIALGTVGAISDWGESLDPIHKNHSPEWHHMKMLHPDKWIQFVPSIFGIGLNVCGVKSPYTRTERLLLRATSLVLSTSVAFGLKHAVKEWRPSGEDDHSFPSGHATTAFQGAELVRMEYGGWYGVAAYVMATGVAVERVVYDKHWIHDVVMGAGIGILSARASLWLLPWEKRLFHLDGKQKKAMAIVPYYDAGNNALGGSFAMTF